MKYKYLLLSVVLLICLNSCKKETTAPTPAVTIVGKWQVTKHNVELSSGGVQISSSTDTTFTAFDFVEYYPDGTGYFSTTAVSGPPSLAEFTYTLSGTSLTQTTSTKLANRPETITSLTTSELTVHAISEVVNTDSGVLYTQVDDYYYKR